MIRDDEGFVQRTKDGYFHATELLNSWNNKNKTKKLMAVYNRLKSTNDFIEQLKEEGIEKPLISSTKGTWMHPKLFIDFAMWVSIEFKSKVIDYVLDGLIYSRHNAGDYYNEMCATILKTHIEYFNRKPDPKLYIIEARRIKSLLGLEKKDRNLMTEEELRHITQMQKLNILLLKKRVGKDQRIKQLKLLSELLTTKI